MNERDWKLFIDLIKTSFAVVAAFAVVTAGVVALIMAYVYAVELLRWLW